ncbi:probable multidrug resistance-associated protein lethal(2)03659 isoform X2 [Venturia canescens]|uniref:probable multidrug resistance-associated protein lethal(2)03659 isoform X2 n=1 Tax=Venturia canescens TaxID=32260 RepID=UPI001C9D0716|nr:probable multidrug resistance-associated protein lethal(2)03659 isoform X2 [Venturia canescens]
MERRAREDEKPRIQSERGWEEGLVVRYFSGDETSEVPTRTEVLCYAGGLVLASLGVTFIMHHTNLCAQQIGMRVRVACCSLIYRKLLRLNKLALNETAAGQVVNLLSNDVNRFDTLPLYLNLIWIMPIQLIVVGYIMWQSVKVSTLVGIGSLLLLAVPIQSYLSRVSSTLRSSTAQLTDRRVQLMNELIAGIQVVKMYAWEKPFEFIVSHTRASEIGVIIKSSFIRGFYLSIMVFTERTTLFLTLASFVLMGNGLPAHVSFSLATYFNILQMTTAIWFPQALILCGEARISINRLENFLLLDEVLTIEDEKRSLASRTKSASRQTVPLAPVRIEFHRVSANWISGILPPTICDVSMRISGGDLCALIGPVGSGKSSILNIVLRELPLGAGTVRLIQDQDNKLNQEQWRRGFVVDNPNLTVSYASQDPWLFGGSVRENILFGQPFDKKRYQEVTKVCSLLRDFGQFPEGDMTIVGERGAALSGGQRARINLARAVYRRADLYLLDDPLSAVDSRVGRQLFKNCILNYLRGKTRILVTHQLQFVRHADTIVLMNRGAVKQQGSWNELMNSSCDFKELISRMEEEKKETAEVEETILDETCSTPEDTGGIQNPQRVEKCMSFRDAQRITNESGAKEVVNDRKFVPPTAIQLRSTSVVSQASSIRSQDSFSMPNDDDVVFEAGHGSDKQETMMTGRMSSRVYVQYFRAGGGIITLTILFLNMIVAQIATSGTDYWLSYWTNIEAVRMSLHDPSMKITSKQYKSVVNDTVFSYFNLLDDDGLLPTHYAIYIYTFCIVACIILTLTRSFLFMNICMKAGRSLHNRMFMSVLETTMKFLNANPSGRTLNRFSKDVGAMDELFPKAMLEALQIFFVMIGILVMVAVVNNWMVIPMVIIAVAAYFIRIFYLNTAQDIKRLEGVAKSPVFSHVSATLSGLTTIRSSGKDIQGMLRKEFDSCQDTHTGAWYLYIVASCSFGLILDIISCIFVACVCYSFILIDPGNSFSGYVGLAISQSLILTGMLQYGVKQSTEVQSQITSVERILQYTDLPKEAPTTSRQPPPATWPERGRIEMKHVFLKYNDHDPPVLKDLNVIIEPGWKIGVVGRTGAGKSSLLSVLFRLFGEGLEGEIKIDDLDTSSIGLQELRSSMSIIPQEPVLFSESLRYNLDPFGKYPDPALWDALREVELEDALLDQKVNEGGSNFSVGQRQLICLARAILRNNKILVLDEATANIDARTDALIQKTIRSKFAECTVITIAHRLNTIIDSDRVLVMGDGKILEFASPYELLFVKENSHFSQMIRQTGETMAKNLMNLVGNSPCRSNSQNQISSL